eukprot:223922-Hanusia_phi.AAC.5
MHSWNFLCGRQDMHGECGVQDHAVQQEHKRLRHPPAERDGALEFSLLLLTPCPIRASYRRRVRRAGSLAVRTRTATSRMGTSAKEEELSSAPTPKASLRPTSRTTKSAGCVPSTSRPVWTCGKLSTTIRPSTCARSVSVPSAGLRATASDRVDVLAHQNHLRAVKAAAQSCAALCLTDSM